MRKLRGRNILFLVVFFIIVIGLVDSKIYLQDDFETDDDLGKWTHPFNADGDIQYSSFAHTGDTSARFHYYIPPEEPRHKADEVFLNHYVSKSDNIETLNVRGYFYIPFYNHPHEGSSRTWRKLYYIKGHEYSWTQTVSVIDVDWNTDEPKLQLTHGRGDGTSEWNLGKLSYDTWYCLEFHTKLSTPGLADGTSKIYLDGELIFEDNTIQNRDSDEDYPLKNVEIGRQVDRDGDTLKREEYRYWDDIVIADSYIGCKDSGSDPPTEPYCGDGNCDSSSGEDCDNCPGDCLDSETEVCCSGTAYVGECCSDSDCSTGYECVNHYCQEVQTSDNQTSDNSMNLYLIKDTFININTETLSQETTLNTYTWPENEIANAIIIKINLSNISSELEQIDNAKLYLYQTDSGGNSNYDLGVHRIINHNPVLSEANGYTYDGVNDWSSSNHRSDGIPLAQGDISSALETKTLDLNTGYKEFDITSLVNYWLENPSDNYGLLINSDNSASSDSYRFFASSENSDSEKRPYVVIDYSSEGTIEKNHPADNNNDGVVDFSEISDYIDRWLDGNITIDQLLSGINKWRGF